MSLDPVPRSNEETRVILWDFDGTLGYRVGGWTGAVLQALQGHPRLSSLLPDDIRPHLQSGFPWHDPGDPHPHITSPKAWWAELYPVFERAFRHHGCTPTEAQRLAVAVRDAYLEAGSWRTYDDVGEVLMRLSQQGWTHYILSNHVPELGEIAHSLGLAPLVARIFTSGETGYEKPHPMAFRIATEGLREGKLWMIGDSFHADYDGARNVGIPSILVRRPNERAQFYAETLDQVIPIVGSADAAGA